MKTNENIYEPNPSGNDYLVALIRNISYVKLLRPEGKPYENLLLWIIDEASKRNNDLEDLPPLKEIAKIQNITAQKVTRYLKAIYENIITYNQAHQEMFVKDGEILCCLSFKYLGAFAYLYQGLKVIPRIGDYFEFDFIEPKVGSGRFWVTNLYHFIENGFQTVSISLLSEQPNLYLKLLSEKAYLRHYITSDKYFGYRQDEIKEKILKFCDDL